MVLLRSAFLAATAALAVLASCNECDFFERCDGSVREICGGADQVVGREVDEKACIDPNPLCVEIDEKNTQCVRDPETPCDPEEFVPSCDGDVLRVCFGVEYTEPVQYDTHFVIGRDCAAAGELCVMDPDSGAMCSAG